MLVKFWKTVFAVAVSALVLSGCATQKSTIESRKQKQYAFYSQLSPEMKSLVDQGKIQVGMPMDAVFIAWGPPSQVSGGESTEGKLVTWIYAGTYLQEYSYWAYRPYYGRRPYYGGPTLEHDYVPQNYVRAEVVFQNGVVQQWRTFPVPP